MSMQNQTPGGFGTAPVKDAVNQVKSATLPAVDELKNQATQAAHDARDTLNTMASEARAKVSDIVDHQKTAGADHLSGIARAAQTAAGDLQDQNPQVARLVRDAAASVDRFAGDLRNSDVRDLLGSVTTFARQQPIAFFAGSVLAGFVLARFLKSEAKPNYPVAYRDHTL
jgi:ABC-type transporter Mla subunit MlaD